MDPESFVPLEITNMLARDDNHFIWKIEDLSIDTCLRDIFLTFEAGERINCKSQWKLVAFDGLTDEMTLAFGLHLLKFQWVEQPTFAQLEVKINDDQKSIINSVDVRNYTGSVARRPKCRTHFIVDPQLVQNGKLTLNITFSLGSRHEKNNLKEINGTANLLSKCAEMQRVAMLDMLKSGCCSDVVLKTADGHGIPAHRNILSASSDVFRVMFATNMKEKTTGIVEMSQISVDALKILLTLMYGGRIDCKWGEHYRDLINASEMYGIPILKEFLDEMLSTLCTKENAVEILQVAEFYGLHASAAKIKTFLLKDPSHLLKLLAKSP